MSSLYRNLIDFILPVDPVSNSSVQFCLILKVIIDLHYGKNALGTKEIYQNLSHYSN